jgi:hypothetical protein
MVRLPSLLFSAFLCACGAAKQNPNDSGAAGQGGGQATGGTAGGAGAKGDLRDAAGSQGDAAIDASGLPPCPEIVAAKFGQVGSNCLRGCEVPEPNDSGILGIIPVCRLTDAAARAFSLSQPAYCVLPESTTFLCAGSDASQ